MHSELLRSAKSYARWYFNKSIGEKVPRDANEVKQALLRAANPPAAAKDDVALAEEFLQDQIDPEEDSYMVRDVAAVFAKERASVRIANIPFNLLIKSPKSDPYKDLIRGSVGNHLSLTLHGNIVRSPMFKQDDINYFVGRNKGAMWSCGVRTANILNHGGTTVPELIEGKAVLIAYTSKTSTDVLLSDHEAIWSGDYTLKGVAEAIDAGPHSVGKKCIRKVPWNYSWTAMVR